MSGQDFLKCVSVGVVALAVLGCVNGLRQSTAHERPPNIVIIFTDDQGYADVGVYGAKGFETPNLDSMAAEGMRFTDFYVSQATCSASRASLLTGCYANRFNCPQALMPWSKEGLNPQEETIAELLKKRS